MYLKPYIQCYYGTSIWVKWNWLPKSILQKLDLNDFEPTILQTFQFYIRKEEEKKNKKVEAPKSNFYWNIGEKWRTQSSNIKQKRKILIRISNGILLLKDYYMMLLETLKIIWEDTTHCIWHIILYNIHKIQWYKSQHSNYKFEEIIGENKFLY